MSKSVAYLTRAGLVLALALVAAGCGKTRDLVTGREKLAFDGQYFRSSLSASKEDRASFSVEVRDAAKSLDGAREAGRHEATKYCIEQYGTSRVDWANGPDSEEITLLDGSAMFSGVCAG